MHIILFVRIWIFFPKVLNVFFLGGGGNLYSLNKSTIKKVDNLENMTKYFEKYINK